MNKYFVTFKSRILVYLACLLYILNNLFSTDAHKTNKGKTRILVFHHVDSAIAFDKIIKTLKIKYNLISFTQYLEGKKSATHVNVIIALDDGYRSWFENGLPVFKKYNVNPLLFVNSDFIGLEEKAARAYCINRIKTWPEPSLSWQELKLLEAHGAEIGGHTIAHRDLVRDESDLSNLECIVADRAALMIKLEKEIRCFAYPFGRHAPTIIQHVKNAGYQYGFSSDSGFTEDSISPFLIKRTNIGMRPPLIICAIIEGWGDKVSTYFRYVKRKIIHNASAKTLP